MNKRSGCYPRVQVDAAASGVVSQAGAVVLVDTARATGLDRDRSRALERWRRPGARHDPGKVVLDLAIGLAVGGDCLADVAVLRGELRLLATAGRLAVSARQSVLHLAAGGRWNSIVLAILTRLRALPAPSG